MVMMRGQVADGDTDALYMTDMDLVFDMFMWCSSLRLQYFTPERLSTTWMRKDKKPTSRSWPAV